MGEALLWTLENGLKEAYTTEVQQAWTVFYGLVSTNMKEGLQEAYAAQNSD